MNQEIERAPFLGDRVEYGLDRRLVGHIAGEHEIGAHLIRQRLDPLLDGVALIGERDLRALIGHSLGDAPGNRAVIGHTEHDAALARHQFSAVGHRLAPSERKASYRAGWGWPEGFLPGAKRPIGAAEEANRGPIRESRSPKRSAPRRPCASWRPRFRGAREGV